MSIEAVGAYLASLREAQQLSPSTLAARIGTTATHLWRIEQGKNKSIGADLIFRFAREVRGDLGHIAALIDDEAAGRDEGQRLAAHYLAAGGGQPAANVAKDAFQQTLKQIRADLDRLERQLEAL